MIYIYKMWDFWNGYWAEDTPETRDNVDDSDNWYYMDQETYHDQKDSIPRDGNLASC